MASLNGTANGSLGEHHFTTAREPNLTFSIRNGGLGAPSNTRNFSPPTTINDALTAYEKQYLPSQPKSLSGIAGRSFLLGATLTLSTILCLHILINNTSPLWRPPFFVALLATFHFLEFLTTAHYNVPGTSISSFLLFSNGWAYTIAHTAALCECLLSNTLLSPYYPNISWLPTSISLVLLVSGMFLVLVGQTVRSIAMCQAGTNFNHIVQHRKASNHQLVTNGLYGYLRHPSYFGFFWWGIGTQLVLGNVVCLAGYAVVLWRFFAGRIRGEEALLIKFFGEEYVGYRKKTVVGIPFIS